MPSGLSPTGTAAPPKSDSSQAGPTRNPGLGFHSSFQLLPSAGAARRTTNDKLAINRDIFRFFILFLLGFLLGPSCVRIQGESNGAASNGCQAGAKRSTSACQETAKRVYRREIIRRRRA